METKRLLPRGFFLVLLTCFGVALGDGGMFFRRATYREADVLQPTQKVYIRWDGSQEKLLIQTKYEGPAEEMVWIVPVPSQPTVQRADGTVFQDLSKQTFDYAIDYTDFAGLELSTLGGSVGGPGGSGTNAVEWHERIGDYDVALLRPVGGEDVIAWLNANDFGIPDEIVPVLEDYIGNGWWMVVARIHPDALKPITRERLAEGTLHPLEMTFQSSACIYPIRLTRMAAGAVEELIYIEGQAHYEPATLTENWWIELFGGPIRKVPENYPLTDIEQAVEIMEGRTQTKIKSCLTKLRRVFQPSEMTEDLVFREADLTQWLASKDALPFALPTTPPDAQAQTRLAAQTKLAALLANSAPVRIAEAATQYGRWRDPNGIASLVSALSAEALDQMRPAPEDFQPWTSPSAKFLSLWGIGKWSWSPTEDIWIVYPGCGYVRSCIWALGEIGTEHETPEAATDKLLECAQHDNQLIRMEAYIALTKLQCERLGPILAERLADALRSSPLPAPWWLDFQAVKAEMDIVADWIMRFGTAQQKDDFINILSELIADIGSGPEWSTPLAYHWWDWLIWQAACTQNVRLIAPLEGLCSRLSPDQMQSAVPFILRAQAACGAPEPVATMVEQILDEANETLDTSSSGIDAYTSLDSLYYYSPKLSLRVEILLRRGLRYELYPMPPEASDNIIRSAMSREPLSEWHALHMLARIKRPQTQDKEALLRIWDKYDESVRLLIVDVLYAWGDVQMLTELHSQAESGEVKSEIAWALAEMEIPEAASIVEAQVRAYWNPQWLSLDRTFIHTTSNSRGQTTWPTYVNADVKRVEETLWDYFHPTSELLDNERLAALKRLAADSTIHAGMRFDWLGKDYGGSEWGLPLLEQAARDILAVDSSPQTVERIISMMRSVGNSGFATEVPSNPQ